MLGLSYMFILPLCLFFVGFWGVLFNRRSIIAIIICIELLLLAVNIQLIFSSFIFDDIFCRTNRIINSFIRFSFYDKPFSGQNQLLSFVDIYTQFGLDQQNEFGFIKPISECPISFTLGDPLLQPQEIHEGYNFYWYTDLVDNSPNKEYELYGVIQFNNAANSRIYELAPSKQFDAHW